MPANYFHLLRRQMHRDFRKPLIVAAPKIGLKHPRAYSKLEEMAEGTKFQPIISNAFGAQGQQVKKVVVCSGKVAFDIEARLEKANLAHAVQVIRCEELAPFPVALIREATSAHQDASITWVQEEPMN